MGGDFCRAGEKSAQCNEPYVTFAVFVPSQPFATASLLKKSLLLHPRD